MNFRTILLIGILITTSANTCEEAPTDPKFTLQHDGYEREYLVHAPKGIDSGQSLPLIFVIHGGGGKAEKMSGMMFHRFNQLADRDKFIVVYPQGIEKSWNDGRNSDAIFSQKHDVDDLGFFSKLIDKMISEYPVDPERVFATGISNGGFMSFQLGCNLSHKIRAIAPVTAQLSETLQNDCERDVPVSLMIINGTNDPLVPYDGGVVRAFGKNRGNILSTAATIAYWKDQIGCTATPIEKTFPNRNPNDGTRVISYTYDNCQNNNQVVLYKIEGGGHTWPGGMQYLGERLVGKTSRDINACDEIWQFFSQF